MLEQRKIKVQLNGESAKGFIMDGGVKLENKSFTIHNKMDRILKNTRLELLKKSDRIQEPKT